METGTVTGQYCCLTETLSRVEVELLTCSITSGLLGVDIRGRNPSRISRAFLFLTNERTRQELTEFLEADPGESRG